MENRHLVCRPERLCNTAVGLNLIVMAVICLFTGTERFTPVRISITLLAVTAGVLIDAINRLMHERVPVPEAVRRGARRGLRHADTLTLVT